MMLATHDHQPYPNREGRPLTDDEKRRGHWYIHQIRRDLCHRQLAPLWLEYQRLARQLTLARHVLGQGRIRIRLCRLERQMHRIRQRWL